MQGGDGGLGRLLRVTPQLQDREICHRGKPENRDIVSTVSAGRAGIHHRVSFMRATKAPFFKHGIKQPFKNGFTKLKIVELPKCVEGFFLLLKSQYHRVSPLTILNCVTIVCQRVFVVDRKPSLSDVTLVCVAGMMESEQVTRAV